MSYNNEQFPQYVKTAGKITVLAALAGLMVFVVAFIFDIGHQEIQKASAQSATTTLTVLNTPPVFTVGAYEVTESSATSPTNSGDDIVWTALGTDSNGAPYFLLICDSNAIPTATKNTSGLGTAEPVCGGGEQWGVSAATPSGTYATVTRQTEEVAPFDESNDWYAWVCDDDAINARCNDTPVQGLNATNSSPFIVNSRPVFTSISHDGPVDPAGTLNFTTDSSDPDTAAGSGPDDLYLVVCSTAGDYNPVTRTCDTNFLASTTVPANSNVSAAYILASIVQDNNYDAFGFLIDQHGHQANDNPRSADFDVNNVAPEVLSGDIVLNGGNDLTLTAAGGETTGFTLEFSLKDANSCVNKNSLPEIIGQQVSVFRSGVGTTACDSSAASYDPNSCYGSGLATSTWNLDCVPTNTCAGPTQDNIDYSCTFPLWFVADPTDAVGTTPTFLQSQHWTAAVAGIDDNFATGTLNTTSGTPDLISLTSIEIVASDIAYGAIEPGDDTGTLSATSTILNIGNTGIDQSSKGEAMCDGFSVGSPCAASASSTIPADQQQFASTSLTYGSSQALSLSGTDQTLELNVNKTTATSTPVQGVTYWGIAVPAAITIAGSYTGLNTFSAITAQAEDWY